MTKYKIEETKGFTKTIGNYVVKRNGKGIQYFWTRAEAEYFLQLSTTGIAAVVLDDTTDVHALIKIAVGE